MQSGAEGLLGAACWHRDGQTPQDAIGDEFYLLVLEAGGQLVGRRGRSAWFWDE